MKNLKARLNRAAYGTELLFERRFSSGGGEAAVIEPYIGYSTPDGLIARGRVLSSIRRQNPNPHQSRWTNLRQMAGLFLTNEVADVTVIASNDQASAVSDSEGYFTLTLPLLPGTFGWIDLPVETLEGAKAQLPVLITDPDAAFGVISDIDDTVIETGAYSLAQNLWTTFTGNALSRHVFPDAVELLRRLHASRNPVFFVSSSPWNLHGFLESVFDRAGVIKGPKFLRDLGLAENKLGAASHGDHKGGAIDTIMAANPGLSFVLIGDTGQHDIEVYTKVAKRHPGRVRRVILRASGTGMDARDRQAAQDLARMRVPVSIGPNYRRLRRVMLG